jgi:ribosomal protein S18 acetylase RimI-like enzyme
MKLTIRKARLEDAEQLAKLYLQFWEAHKNPSPLHEPRVKVDYNNLVKDAKKTIKDKEIYTYVAEENGEIVGYIGFLIWTNISYFKIRKYGYIDEIVVDKKHRKTGIARQLLDFTEELFRKRGIRYIQLRVELKNEIAQKAWEKMGFKRDSIEYLKEIK